MQIEPQAIRNILVVRNDRFGEFLLNIPALRALKETFVNAKIIAVVNAGVKELAQDTGYIDEIITWDSRKNPLSEKMRLINFLKSKGIEIAIMLNPSRAFNIFSFLAGIPIRVGYDRKWGFLLTHKIKDIKYLGQRHEIEYNLELLGLVGAGTRDRSLSLRVDDNLAQEFRDLNLADSHILIALHPWTSDPIKQWPIENFSALARELVKQLNVKIVVIGGQEELSKSKGIFNNLDDKIINLTGKTTLRQLAALLKISRLLISCDSGPVHLACAVGTPVVAIFRSDMPAKSAKRWGPWLKGSTVLEKDRLCDISVDEVFNKAKGALGIL